MDGVVGWLESPEGEEWSRYWHKANAPQLALVTVKDGTSENPLAVLFHNGYYDHLVEYEPGEWEYA